MVAPVPVLRPGVVTTAAYRTIRSRTRKAWLVWVAEVVTDWAWLVLRFRVTTEPVKMPPQIVMRSIAIIISIMVVPRSSPDGARWRAALRSRRVT